MKFHAFSSAARYAWSANTIYDVHAPRAFSFLGEVVEDKRHFYAFDWIQELRDGYAADQSEITLSDFGAGSRAASAKTRKVSHIARMSGSPKRFGEYLYKTADWLKAKRIIELGSNLGIGTSYLAAALPSDGKLISIDADINMLIRAKAAVKSIAPEADAKLLLGTFVDQLQPALNELQTVDLAFIDGHHAEQATKDYFVQILKHCHANSVIILDDIHWSPGMEAAWEWVKAQRQVTCSIDLFRWGVVMLDPSIRIPQHLTIVPWLWKPWHMGFFSSRVG